jgi:2-aminobenzoate-CoA ligase
MTAHQDTFRRDNLPPHDQWPELVFDLPEPHYPDRLNAAVELLEPHDPARAPRTRLILRRFDDRHKQT